MFGKRQESLIEITKCKCRQKSSNGKQEPHGDSGSDLKRGQGDVELVNSGRRLSLEAGPGATFTPISFCMNICAVLLNEFLNESNAIFIRKLYKIAF